MRKSELLSLEWTDIDFKNRQIRVDNKEEHYTKNYEPRTIPLNKVLYSTLKKITKQPDSNYVFCDKIGNKFGDGKKGFKTAIAKAGIENFSLITY